MLAAFSFLTVLLASLSTVEVGEETWKVGKRKQSRKYFKIILCNQKLNLKCDKLVFDSFY